MWPFNRKKKEAPKRVTKVTPVLDKMKQRINQNFSSSNHVPTEDRSILTDPLLSPLSPISPFYIGHSSSESHTHHDHGDGGSFGGGGSTDSYDSSSD